MRNSKENFPNILKLADGLKEIGKKYDATADKIALAWVLTQGEDVIPIPGTTSLPVRQNFRRTRGLTHNCVCLGPERGRKEDKENDPVNMLTVVLVEEERQVNSVQLPIGWKMIGYARIRRKTERTSTNLV